MTAAARTAAATAAVHGGVWRCAAVHGGARRHGGGQTSSTDIRGVLKGLSTDLYAHHHVAELLQDLVPFGVLHQLVRVNELALELLCFSQRNHLRPVIMLQCVQVRIEDRLVNLLDPLFDFGLSHVRVQLQYTAHTHDANGAKRLSVV